MMKKQAKNIWWILGVIAVFGALALPKVGSLSGKAGLNKSNNAAGTPRHQRMPVRTQIVQTEKLGDRILTVGTILSNEEVEIRSEISGKVEKIYFREGVPVRKGEVLLKINDAEPSAQLVRGQYRQALAERDAERQRQ